MSRDDTWDPADGPSNTSYLGGNGPFSPNSSGPPPTGGPGGTGPGNGPQPNTFANAHPGPVVPGTTGPFNGYDPNSITVAIGADGKEHVYGTRRIISGDPKVPGQQTFTDQTDDLGTTDDLATVSTNSQIPVGVLQNQVAQVRVQQGQTQAQGVKLGRFTILGISKDANGNTVWRVQKGDGGIFNSTEENLRKLDISQSDIDQAKAQWTSNQATLTKMGEFHVVGTNDDGSMTVMKGDGTISTITRAQVQNGEVPGVTTSDFDQATAQEQSNKATLTKGGQWSVSAVNPGGTITIKNNGTSEIKTVSAAEAMKTPGVDPLEVQQKLQQANSSNFQGASVGSAMGFGGYQPVPSYPIPTGTAPNPSPPPPSPGTDPHGYPYPPSNGSAPPGRGGMVTQGGAPNPMPVAASDTNTTPATPSPGYSYQLPTRAMGAGTTGQATATPNALPSTSGGAGAASTPGSVSGAGAASSTATTSPYTAQYQKAVAAYGSAGGTNPVPRTAPGGTNDLSVQQLGQQTQARQDYYNYGRAAKDLLTAQTAGQSRDTSGTGFGSITSTQRLAGQ